MASDTPTRVANELFDAAAREGAFEHRSAKGQINYWARIGQRVTRRDTVSRRRIERCIAGELPWTALAPAERVIANAEIDVAIDTLAERVSLGAAASETGVVTVALDEHGTLCEYHPDGTTVPLG